MGAPGETTSPGAGQATASRASLCGLTSELENRMPGSMVRYSRSDGGEGSRVVSSSCRCQVRTRIWFCQGGDGGPGASAERWRNGNTHSDKRDLMALEAQKKETHEARSEGKKMQWTALSSCTP